MENIEHIFVIALKRLLEDAPRGERSRLAELLELAPSQITDILKERRPSSESQRRTVAQYFRCKYEDFLDIGRALLAGLEPYEIKNIIEFKQAIESGTAPQALCGYRNLRLVREFDSPYDGRKIYCDKWGICGPVGYGPIGAITTWNEKNDCSNCPKLKAPRETENEILGSVRENMSEATSLFVAIPKVAVQLSAGPGVVAYEEDAPQIINFAAEWLKQFGNPKSLVMMDVRGDSMEPLISADDQVVVDRSKTDLIEGKIYAVAFDGMLFLKRVFMRPGQLILRSENRAVYEDIVVNLRDEYERNAVIIIGRAMWWGHLERF